MSCTTTELLYSYEAVNRYVPSKTTNTNSLTKKLVSSSHIEERVNETPFDELPEEILCLILEFVDQTEHSFLTRLVCKLWSRLITTPKNIQFKVAEQYIHNLAAIQLLELQWPRTFLAKCAISLSIRAAKLGHIETLKWIRSKNYIWNEEVCAAAAKSGHSSLLLWLHENDCPWNENTFANAVKNGCLDTLKWLRTTDCPMDEDCFIYAAKNGDMAILEWLKSEKCPWSEDAYIEAIGNMDILAWLNKNGCPWSDRVSLIAARREQWKTLQWLEANGCPMHTNIEMNSSQ